MNSFWTSTSQKCQRKATKVPFEYSSDTQKTTTNLHSFKILFIKYFPIFYLLLIISPAISLTSEERGELARKFKYYHKSVRPSEQFNIVDTINGTFFRLLTQLELVETRELDLKAQLSLEMSLFVHFRDDRLQLRDLQDMPIPIPEEFQPWQPKIQLFPMGTTRAIQMQRMANLSPKNGQLTIIHRYSGPLLCDFDHWRVPFERYQCQFWFETDPDERLHLTVVRDLRPNGQIVRIQFEYEQWPWLLLRFQFHSGQWQCAIVSAFLPSLLLLFCTILAQWKRRKIQVLVSLGSILALIFIENGNQQTNNAASTLSTTINLFDLWFAGIFVHLICLLAADLLLPARRLLVFKKAYQWSEDERRNSQQKGGAYASPAISQRKLDGIHSVRRIRATMFPATTSTGSLQHHYVSSPQLGHGRQLKQRAVARLPATPSASPAQMIRTFSVPPRRLDDVRREQLEEPSPLLPLMGGSAPLSRKRTGPGGLDGMETDARERAIASLLSEMESIRKAESTSGKNNRIIRRAASSEDEEEEAFGAGPSATTPLRIAQLPPVMPPPPPPPTLPPSIGTQSSEDELGRLEGIGMPRRKRIVLYAILMSLCLFLCTYTLLAISALYDWL